jgi:dienelactone hydrolase
VRRVKVEGQLHGVLFLPDTTEKRPGVLVLGGSEGGLQPEKAAWLASRGFAAFALAYFHYEDLPRQLAGIPLEYFVQAINWMAQRPEILPDRIGVMGTSRGGELALILGSAVPQIKAVVAYVPASFVYPACCEDPPLPYAWTWRGRPLTYVPRRELRNMQAMQQAAIPVEQTKGPILMISGKDDGVWESANMADEVVNRLKHAHFAYRYENFKYPHAGHRAGRPEIVPTWHGKMRHPVSGTLMDPGGDPEGDANSTLESIPRVLDFLKESLLTPASH